MPKIIENPVQAILEQSRNILYNEGYEALSIRRVAKACGMATGTIYNYFPTKKDIVTKIMSDYWEDYYHALEHIDRDKEDIYQKLREIYNQLEAFVNTFREMWVKMNTAVPEYSEAGMQRRKSFTERLILKLEEILLRQAHGKPGSISLESGSYDIAKFIIMNFIMMAQMRQYEYDSFERILKKVLK